MELLINYWPMADYSLTDDGMGNLVIVWADQWAAAFYFIHGRMI